MARDWPAGDMMPLIALIADPRTVVSEGDKVRLSDEQARAILALQLSRLTGLGRDDIAKAANEIAEEIKELLDILGSRERILAIIRDELIGVKEAFGVPRRTTFSESEGEIDDEALIPREDMVVTVTHGGYVKRTPLAAYRTQRRGGRGRAGMAMKDEDFVTRVFVASTHAPILFFSSSGMAYKMKAWRIPAGDPRTKGRALVNLLPLGQGETITSVMALPEDERDWDKLDVMFATKLRRRAAQQAQRLRAGEPQRQDRHEARRGRRHHRRADLHRGRRHSAHHRERPVRALPHDGRARVQGPHLHRRARHQPGGWRLASSAWPC